MQVGRTKPSQQEKMRRSQEGLCFYCEVTGHQVSSCPLKVKPSSSRGQGLRSVTSSQEPRLPHVCANLLVNGKEFSVKSFNDSGADSDFIDIDFAKSLGIQILPSAKPRSVLALDGHTLNQSSMQTQEVRLCICGNHVETLTILTITSPDLPIFLGATWLRKHNSHIDWRSSNILGWSEQCLTNCLQSAVIQPYNQKIKEVTPNLAHIPQY